LLSEHLRDISIGEAVASVVVYAVLLLIGGSMNLPMHEMLAVYVAGNL
jgi:hypothetical protein